MIKTYVKYMPIFIIIYALSIYKSTTYRSLRKSCSTEKNFKYFETKCLILKMP